MYDEFSGASSVQCLEMVAYHTIHWSCDSVVMVSCMYSKGSVRVQPLGHQGAALEMNRQGQGSFPPDSLI